MPCNRGPFHCMIMNFVCASPAHDKYRANLSKGLKLTNVDHCMHKLPWDIDQSLTNNSGYLYSAPIRHSVTLNAL